MKDTSAIFSKWNKASTKQKVADEAILWKPWLLLGGLFVTAVGLKLLSLHFSEA